MNQPSEVDDLIEQRIKIASTESKSNDEVVQIAWLADGIDLWHRSDGKRGHSPAEAQRYIISSVTRLIASKVLEAETKLAKGITLGGKGGTELFYQNIPIENYIKQLQAQREEKK
jgi:hypothetical protein